MLRVVALGSCLLMALAGCSGGPDPPSGTETSSPAASSSSRPAVAVPLAPVLTDTLHLLDAPHMAATLNPRSQPFRTLVPSAADAFAGLLGAAPLPKWTLPETNLTAFAGSVVVWVEVDGFVAHQDATNPCFWQLAIRLERDDGGFYQQSGGCVPEPAVVPEGIRAIEFPFEGIDFSAFNGTTVAIQLTTSSLVAAPGATVSALSGTLDYDSTMTVRGLQVPLDTQTLLA